MSLDFDALKMATQVTLDRLIGNLRLEMTDDIGERGGIPRCGKGVEGAGEDFVLCEEEQEVEVALVEEGWCRM
eukprot:scaffold23973_cov58-Attheya_sp.AAC.4